MTTTLPGRAQFAWHVGPHTWPDVTAIGGMLSEGGWNAQE